MTDLPILREALIHAETHHAGLKALQSQLRHAAGATPMDAADGVGELVRRLRAAIEHAEDSERADAELDAELRELGIDPADLDDEDDEPGWPLPPGVAVSYRDAPDDARSREDAVYMVPLHTVMSPLALEMLGNSWLFRRPASPHCYEASFGTVHSRPSCRCPKR